MKTHLPQHLLAALLCCSVATAETWTTEEKANCDLPSAKQVDGFSRTVTTVDDKTILTYDNTRSDSKTLTIKDSPDFDTTGYDTFSVTTSQGSSIVITNTTLKSNDVVFDGTVCFQGSSTMEAKNLILAGNSVVRNNATITASETVTLKDSAVVWFGSSVSAKNISLESTSSNVVYQAELNADTVSINGSNVEIGGNKKATINAQQININSGSLSVAKDGNLSTKSITISGGTLTNYGTIGTADSGEGIALLSATVDSTGTIIIKSGEVKNYGTISDDIQVEAGGTLTLEDAAQVGNVTMSDGSILNLEGNATVGALTLDGGQINIGGDYTIDLGGNALSIADDVVITYTVASVDNLADSYTFFTNVDTASSTGLDTLTVTLTDAAGGEVTISAVSDGKGNVVYGNIPEPTTATLSLLALAALAARRRRK